MTFTRRRLLGMLGVLLAAPLAVFQGRDSVTIIKGSSMGFTTDLDCIRRKSAQLGFTNTILEQTLSIADIDRMVESAKNLNPPIQPDNGYYHMAIHPKTQKRLEREYGAEWKDVLLANGVQIVAYKRVS